MSKIKIYLKAILLPLLLGILLGIIISGYIDYNSLQKPPLSPPSIAFPIVWTILYILMGISYGILESSNLTNSHIDSIYYLQLIVNLLWPLFFFVFKLRLVSIFIIILLALLVLKMIIKFYKQNKLSGILQIPYFLWTVFATYLNIGIYLLNR